MIGRSRTSPLSSARRRPTPGRQPSSSGGVHQLPPSRTISVAMVDSVTRPSRPRRSTSWAAGERRRARSSARSRCARSVLLCRSAGVLGRCGQRALGERRRAVEAAREPEHGPRLPRRARAVPQQVREGGPVAGDPELRRGGLQPVQVGLEVRRSSLARRERLQEREVRGIRRRPLLGDGRGGSGRPPGQRTGPVRRARRDRLEHPGLHLQLLELRGRLRGPRDPAAHAVGRGAVGPVHDDRADRDGEGAARRPPTGRGLARRRHPADRAAVGAARSLLEPGEQRHRRGLRRARDGAAREQRRHDLGEPGPGGGTRRDGARHLPQRGIGLGVQQRGHRDRTGLGAAGQVVAQQVDDHDVLRPLLGAAQQVRAGVGVRGGAAPPARRALHRPGREPVPLAPHEQLGARAEHDMAPQVQVGAVARALTVEEIAMAGEEVPLDPTVEPRREVRLVGGPLGDRLMDGVDGPGVLGRAPPRRPRPGAVVTACAGSAGRVLRIGGGGDDEPHERQRGGAGCDRQRRVQPGRGLVGDHAGRPGSGVDPRLHGAEGGEHLVRGAGDDLLPHPAQLQHVPGPRVLEAGTRCGGVHGASRVRSGGRRGGAPRPP